MAYDDLESMISDAKKDGIVLWISSGYRDINYQKKLFNRQVEREKCKAVLTQEEAEKRGLCNFKTTVDALKHSLDEKNIELFKTHKVLSERELVSRYEIHMENYCKILNIESKVMLKMVNNEILPVVTEYSKELSDSIVSKSQIDKKFVSDYELDLFKTISSLISSLHNAAHGLEEALEKIKLKPDLASKADLYKTEVLESMSKVREIVDTLEINIPRAKWPSPTYDDILFSV